MDKNRFRNISFCAIGALLALALVQAWSLWRMYADRAEEFSRKVTLAMNRAAYDDLLIGNRRRTSQTRTSVVTTGNIDSVRTDMIGAISVENLGTAGKVISLRPKVDTVRTNIALRRGDKTRYIYQEVHMPSFTALQFNLSRYDSLLTRYLADAGIGQVTRQQGVVAGQVELEGRERRHMHLLINITGLVAAAQGDVRPHRVDLRPEGDHLAGSSEVLYRDRTDHIRPHGVDIARRHDRRPGLRRPAPVTYQQVVVRRAVHGERHLARKLLRTVGIHPPQAPRLHEGQRQQGADRAERDISETVLIHGQGVYTAKIRIKTLLPPALTLFNTS